MGISERTYANDAQNQNLNLYGDLIIQLKRTNLEDRTTFTVGDSLDSLYMSHEFEEDKKTGKFHKAPEGSFIMNNR